MPLGLPLIPAGATWGNRARFFRKPTGVSQWEKAVGGSLISGSWLSWVFEWGRRVSLRDKGSFLSRLPAIAEFPCLVSLPLSVTLCKKKSLGAIGRNISPGCLFLVRLTVDPLVGGVLLPWCWQSYPIPPGVGGGAAYLGCLLLPFPSENAGAECHSLLGRETQDTLLLCSASHPGVINQLDSF